VAISNYYCDFATGNDYIGATFTDGAFTNADMTLTKAGAFAAASPDHWLYLADNGSGEVTAGYYKIASVTSDNAVVLATDPRSGVNDPTDVVCTQHDGTAPLPFRSVQGALDLVTRDAVNGDQINIKAGTSQTLAATLAIDEYGTPAEAAPLVISGYTAVADDGGQGVIDGDNTYAIISWAAIDWVLLKDMRFTNTAANAIVRGHDHWTVLDCEFDTTTEAWLAIQDASIVLHCYFHDSTKFSPITLAGMLLYCVISSNHQAEAVNFNLYGQPAVAIGNAIYCTHNDGSGLHFYNGSPAIAIGNMLYKNAAAPSASRYGIRFANAVQLGLAINNIVVGWSGSGNYGIGSEVTNVLTAGHNAFYNNTADETWARLIIDLGGDVSLAAVPWTDAANGDWSLTTAAKSALGELGYPLEMAGNSTDLELTIGAIQQAVAAGGGGGFPKIASLLGRTRM